MVLMTLSKFTFKGLSHLPDEYWKPYFAESVIGRTYEVLLDDSGFLVMSNTEVEQRSNQAVLEASHGDVLLVGLGINLINDEVLKKDNVNSVVTMENSPYVIDKIPTKTDLIEWDASKHNPKFDGAFDFIWWDALGEANVEVMEQYLKPGGELLFWDIDYGK